ncbi:uncharacterized protein [Palaemon carinicauda]|uniref:uncharacterized protein n=1 Tax=Palaemon carinicauda TaxID=392227 RepID=UPI0035B61C69
MESSVLECGVCTNPFSEEHCPKILPCSHTFCCRCIDEIISNQTKACPFCREEFTASSTDDLVFNRTVLEAAKQFLSFHKEPKISSRGSGMSFGNLNKDLREIFILKAIANCNEVTSQMMHDISILMRMDSDILQANKVIVGLKEMLNEIEISNRDIRYTIDENIKQLKKKCDVINEDVGRFKDYDARLEAAVDFTSAGAIMDNSIDDLHNVQAKVLEIKGLLRENEQKTDDIVKGIMEMQTSLRNVAEEIDRIVEEDLPKVLAVKPLEGRHRIGTLKIGSKNRVFMSHLEEGDTQVTSCAIKESSVLECGVCTNPFSEEHCPKILPCSHTFCCRCIEEIISNQTKACPFCREEFTASSTDDLLFNRTVLDAAKQFFSHKEPKMSSRGPGISFGNFNNDSRENFFTKAIANCNEVMSQMRHDISILVRMNSDILQANKVIVGLKEMLNEIEISNRDILYTIDENIKWLKKKCDVIDEDARRFKGCEARLKAAVSFTSAGAIMDDSIDDLHNFQAKVLGIKMLLRENEQKPGDIVKEIIKMQTNLRNVAEEIDRIVEDDLPKVLVFAVNPLSSRHRIGTLKFGSKNRVFMSHLEEGDTQVTSCAIKLESLMPKTSRRVFLDLGTDGRFLGRMIIKVIDEGNLALNFLHMCAGDLGPSYANSSIIGIGLLGEPGENVDFGDYVVEDRTTASPVLLGVDWKSESKKDIYDNTQAREGEVRGYFDENPNCEDVSRFYIVLREDSEWMPRDRLGVVEEGLQVLKDAIMLYPNFREIKIVDCGHVFCF